MSKYESHAKVSAELFGVGFLLAGIIFPIVYIIMGTFKLEMLLIPAVAFPIAGVFFYMRYKASKFEE